MIRTVWFLGGFLLGRRIPRFPLQRVFLGRVHLRLGRWQRGRAYGKITSAVTPPSLVISLPHVLCEIKVRLFQFLLLIPVFRIKFDCLLCCLIFIGLCTLGWFLCPGLFPMYSWNWSYVIHFVRFGGKCPKNKVMIFRSCWRISLFIFRKKRRLFKYLEIDLWVYLMGYRVHVWSRLKILFQTFFFNKMYVI